MAYSQSNVATQSDTPFSFPLYSKSVVKMKEKVETVLDAVVAELSGHVRFCATGSFLDALLPVPSETLDAILASVENAGGYSATEQRWTGFPTAKDATESSFYQPFLKAAEAIRAAVPDKVKNRLAGEWYDRHDKSPGSSEESAQARPDILFVSRPMVVKKLEEEVRVLEQEVKQSAPQPLGKSNRKKEKLVRQAARLMHRLLIDVLGGTAEYLVATSAYTCGNKESQYQRIV